MATSEGRGGLCIFEGRGVANGEENTEKCFKTLEKKGSKVCQRLWETAERGRVGHLEGNNENLGMGSEL